MSHKVLKTVIIDDSELQLKFVGKLVNKHPSLVLEGVYDSAVAAKRGLKDNSIDLIILDVEMPVIDGFDFLDTLENKPQVILISGKSEYALRAFDYDVTDYLQKPVAQDRFDTAIQRALANQEVVGEAKGQEFIFVSSNLQKKKVIINEIKWIEALGDYIKLVTMDDRKILVLSTMKSFLERLPKEKFVRIHKSYSVNVDRVEKFSSTNVEIGGKQIPMSRLKKENLEKALLDN